MASPSPPPPPPPAALPGAAFQPETGRCVCLAPGLARVTAPNASPYTYTGTNSFLVGRERLALIDPGPDDPTHLAALNAAMAGRRLEVILLTHTHRDHSAAAARLARRHGVPLWFGGPHRLSRPLRRFECNLIARACDWDLKPDRTLCDGETVIAGDRALTVHATPGHCANHLVFGLAGTDILLSGDHVMGWNSTLVSVPDGSMADYLAALDSVIALPYRLYHPAHGGPIADGPARARALKAHRHARNRQVIEAIGAGARRVGAVTAAIYADQPPKIRLAARMTVLAHIEYLEAHGKIRVRRDWRGTRLTLP